MNIASRRYGAPALAVLLVLPALVVGGPAAAAAPAVGVHILAAHSNKCVNVQGAVTTNSAAVIQYTCSTRTNDDWRAVAMGDGTYQLVVTHSGKCLNVKGGVTTNNAAIIQYTCTAAGAATKNDRWRPRPVPGTQRFQLVAEHSGKCLNVDHAKTTDSAAILQYTCTTPGGAYLNDQWYAPPATASAPAVPLVADMPLVALQAPPPPGATVGALNYAYVDNIGRLVHGYQPDPANVAGVQWSVISGGEAFAGRPGLAAQRDGRVQVVGHNDESDVWLRTQADRATPGWGSWQDTGGATANHPAVGTLPDGGLVVFALDASGALWALPQDGRNTPFIGWRSVGGSGLVGTPTVVTIRDGLQLFAYDGGGALRTATYRAGALSDWTGLGGSGLTGAPAAVVYPGYRIRVFARSADGTIVTKRQDAEGVFEADWQPVGSLVTAGSPTALVSPVRGRVEVVVRTPDGGVWSTGETAQGSGTWREWQDALGSPAVVTATDPVAFTYSDGAQRWAFVIRTTEGDVRIYVASESVTAAAAREVRGPRFAGRELPAVPR
ncbi:MAG TPA: RICIN domain-containing protein [Micromonosporaceae bacterium]|nr:RICIN domain-containing protein [Micromonosporaceae bacterium]